MFIVLEEFWDFDLKTSLKPKLFKDKASAEKNLGITFDQKNKAEILFESNKSKVFKGFEVELS